MKKLIATTALALLAATQTAQAWEYLSPADNTAYTPIVDIFEMEPVVTKAPILEASSKIAVARLDGGRLIPTPYGEQEDWTFLDRRMDADIQQLTAAKYIDYIPEIPFHGQDTDNKIDEIRLTAANEGMDYVLIYGVGPDASWASFGKKALYETGLSIDEDSPAWDAAEAKALLVESHSGKVLGAVTADEIEYNIGQLADRVGSMIETLSSPTVTEA